MRAGSSPARGGRRAGRGPRGGRAGGAAPGGGSALGGGSCDPAGARPWSPRPKTARARRPRSPAGAARLLPAGWWCRSGRRRAPCAPPSPTCHSPWPSSASSSTPSCRGWVRMLREGAREGGRASRSLSPPAAASPRRGRPGCRTPPRRQLSTTAPRAGMEERRQARAPPQSFASGVGAAPGGVPRDPWGSARAPPSGAGGGRGCLGCQQGPGLGQPPDPAPPAAGTAGPRPRAQSSPRASRPRRSRRAGVVRCRRDSAVRALANCGFSQRTKAHGDHIAR